MIASELFGILALKPTVPEALITTLSPKLRRLSPALVAMRVRAPSCHFHTLPNRNPNPADSNATARLLLIAGADPNDKKPWVLSTAFTKTKSFFEIVFARAPGERADTRLTVRMAAHQPAERAGQAGAVLFIVTLLCCIFIRSRMSSGGEICSNHS